MIRVSLDERAEGNRGEIETTSAACDMIHWEQPRETTFYSARFSSPFVKPDAIDDK